jgi:LSD1 subclass zinc finger protein
MNLIAVLIDEYENILCAYGPFPSSEALREFVETSLKFVRGSEVNCWSCQEVTLVGVTEDKG